ncbi:DUF6456 domain-containing protein [Phyllobacterium lublinensis]|uniref:DUF6456 domain-containing protein n=1 Tax=Phyllobacterium lublinensis TaxID=2875708 RepID=UPI001CCCF14E|nr:DUF6456 domain-containing protein [Phyllobacterium sp. 2063]MBZ9654336.1 DUF6456 domain-containing protein [Phyllobacterium sp. 2063]
MTVRSREKAISGAVQRLLRFISKSAVEIVEARQREKLMLDSGTHGTISVDRDAVKQVVSQGLATILDNKLAISDAGRCWLRRTECQDEPFAGQHRREDTLVVTDDGADVHLRVNTVESPLAMLRRRRDTSGAPLIGDAAFKAGERLRADFTLGSLMPRIGMNWNATGTGSHSNGVMEITEAALAARRRVDRALEAVGPELSGVLVDMCCFLKGLETIERERQWPARSAKLILKTALAVLDRHYYPPAPSRTGPSIIHWGTEDYRPVLNQRRGR